LRRFSARDVPCKQAMTGKSVSRHSDDAYFVSSLCGIASHGGQVPQRKRHSVGNPGGIAMKHFTKLHERCASQV
jgi:hypothetical protein